MLKVHADAKTGYLELTVDGAIKKADFEAVIAAVDELIKSNKTVNVVEVVGEIGWVDVEIWWKDILFQLTHHKWLGRVAVVSDKGWVGPLTRFFAPLYPAEIRVFGLKQLDDARHWAKVGDVGMRAD